MNRQFAVDLETDLTRGHVLEWAELYALDAISDEERGSLDAFLADAAPETRATFTERVRACRETVTTAYAIDEVDPPADLFERILAQLPGVQGSGMQDSGPHGPGSRAAAAQGADDASATPPPALRSVAGTPAATEPAQPTGRDELAGRRAAKASGLSRAGRWMVAAAAAAVLAVGGVTVAQNLQQTSLEQQVLQASDVRTQQLTLESGGTAELAMSSEENAAVVTLSGVPAPTAGSVYQMWRIPSDGSSPVSVGTMSGEDVAGSNRTELRDIGGFSAIALTLEPEGGSETPTMPIVAQIPLDA